MLLDVVLILPLWRLRPEPCVTHGAAPGVGVDVVVDVGLELLQVLLGEGGLAQRAVEDAPHLVLAPRGHRSGNR